MLQFKPRSAEDRTPLGGCPDWFSALLRARGVDTEEKARRFLAPKLSDLHDPSLLRDLDRAVELLRRAIAAGDRILIYGDYDCDGVCATAILLETLREEGADADFRIPSRHAEGYGLNEEAVRAIHREGFRLLITVDCGISGNQEVALAKSLGMTVIVTDHHEPPDTLPPADAVLDPLLGDYPFRRLCGAGVALKLCQALQGMPGVEKRLDLAALATVADVVPLIDENRVIVREGMARMASTARPGLRALMDVAAIRPPLRADHLAFRLGPRLNAAGRLEEAGQAVTLLTTRDETEARSIAAHLEENNRLRQRMEREITAQAAAQAAEACFREDRILIIEGEGWNTGLIGLAAGRLCERFHYPVIVLSRQGENAVGSCRSIPGVHIYRMLSLCGDLFVRFGGHEQAAGLTIPAHRIPELRRRLNRVIRESVPDSAFLPVREYDLALPFRVWDAKSLELLESLEPTGCGNPAPVFLIADAGVQEMRRVGQDRSHLKLTLADAGGTALGGIAFSLGEEADRGHRRVDALYTPAVNEFNGRRSVELQVQALRPSAGGAALPAPEAILESLKQELRLLPANETGYPVGQLPRLNRTRALDFLRRPMGTLLLTRNRQRARDYAAEVSADLCAGRVTDPRGFSSVLCAADMQALRDQWLVVLLGDGDILPGEAELLRSRCPHADLYALEPDEAIRSLIRRLI